MRSLLFIAFTTLLIGSKTADAQTLFSQDTGSYVALGISGCYLPVVENDCELRGTAGYRLNASFDLALNVGFSYGRGPGNPLVFLDGSTLQNQRLKLGASLNPTVGYTGRITQSAGIRVEGGLFADFTNDTTWVERDALWFSRGGLNGEVAVFRSLKISDGINFQPSLGAFGRMAWHAADADDYRQVGGVPRVANPTKHRFIGGPVLRLPLAVDVFNEKLLIVEFYQELAFYHRREASGARDVLQGYGSGGLSLGFNF